MKMVSLYPVFILAHLTCGCGASQRHIPEQTDAGNAQEVPHSLAATTQTACAPIWMPAAPDTKEPAVIALYAFDPPFALGAEETPTHRPSHLLAIAIWRDGRVMWSRRASTDRDRKPRYGPPYLVGRISRAAVAKLLDTLWQHDLLSDPQFDRSFGITEFPAAYLTVADGERQQEVESSLDFYYAQSHLPARALKFLAEWNTVYKTLIDSVPAKGKRVRATEIDMVPVEQHLPQSSQPCAR